MNQAQARAKAAAIKQAELLIANARIKLECDCPHVGLAYKYGASSGNYDLSVDSYWTDWHCQDCGKRWQTDQSVNHNLKYPHAKNATRS